MPKEVEEGAQKALLVGCPESDKEWEERRLLTEGSHVAVRRLFRLNSGLRIAQGIGKAGIEIMEERLQLDVKAWLTSKEKARIEVSETSQLPFLNNQGTA